jgi:hypothetical protein
MIRQSTDIKAAEQNATCPECGGQCLHPDLHGFGFLIRRHRFVSVPGVNNCARSDDDGHWCNRDESDPMHFPTPVAIQGGIETCPDGCTKDPLTDPEVGAEEEMSNVKLDWPAWLAGADDLVVVQRAVVREGAIRRVMAETGESREVVAESLDAMEAMDQEAVLELADGNPTTLADALTRYIRIVRTWEEPDGRVDRDVVLSDLSAILEYPWRDEESLLALHEPNGGVQLHIEEGDNRDLEIRIGDNRSLVATVNWEEAGSAGQHAAEQVARAVHRAVLVRVLADRDHTVQLNAVQTADLAQWLTRPNGSMSDGQRLSVDAVSGGGVLVRTRPYSYQRPGPALAKDQERYDARRVPAPTVDGIGGHFPMAAEELEYRSEIKMDLGPDLPFTDRS